MNLFHSTAQHFEIWNYKKDSFLETPPPRKAVRMKSYLNVFSVLSDKSQKWVCVRFLMSLQAACCGLCGQRADVLKQLIAVQRTPLFVSYSLSFLLHKHRVDWAAFLQDFCKHNKMQQPDSKTTAQTEVSIVHRVLQIVLTNLQTVDTFQEQPSLGE